MNCIEMVGWWGEENDVEISGLRGNKAVDGVSFRLPHASGFTGGLETGETSLGLKERKG